MIPLRAISIHRHNLICLDDLFKTFYCTEYLFFMVVFLINIEEVSSQFVPYADATLWFSLHVIF